MKPNAIEKTVNKSKEPKIYEKRNTQLNRDHCKETYSNSARGSTKVPEAQEPDQKNRA
jgi:hypothetical protein